MLVVGGGPLVGGARAAARAGSSLLMPQYSTGQLPWRQTALHHARVDAGLAPLWLH
jgi:hypothetical protein